MQVDGARTHALWIYGTIVALGIQQAMTTVFPHLVTPDSSTVDDSSRLMVETWRLVAYLTMVTRFYLGAAAYASRCSDRDYSLDFLIGLLHFMLFYAWSLTLTLGFGPEDGNGQRYGEGWFLALMCIILGYNVLWWIARYFLVGNPLYMVRVWTIVNAVTVLLVVALHGMLQDKWNWTPADAEATVLGIVIVVSWLDIAEVVQYADERTGPIKNFLEWATRKDPTQPPTASR